VEPQHTEGCFGYWRKTASGIVIPDTAAEKPDQGEIMAVGKDPMDPFAYTQKTLADFHAWACEMVTGDFAYR
jgi:chaperonin GroES